MLLPPAIIALCLTICQRATDLQLLPGTALKASEEDTARFQHIGIAPCRSQGADALQPFPIGRPEGQADAGALHLTAGYAEEVGLGQGVVEDHQHKGPVSVVVQGLVGGVVA